MYRVVYGFNRIASFSSLTEARAFAEQNNGRGYVKEASCKYIH